MSLHNLGDLNFLSSVLISHVWGVIIDHVRSTGEDNVFTTPRPLLVNRITHMRVLSTSCAGERYIMSWSCLGYVLSCPEGGTLIRCLTGEGRGTMTRWPYRPPFTWLSLVWGGEGILTICLYTPSLWLCLAYYNMGGGGAWSVLLRNVNGRLS